jgi:hypothetical protein
MTDSKHKEPFAAVTKSEDGLRTIRMTYVPEKQTIVITNIYYDEENKEPKLEQIVTLHINEVPALFQLFEKLHPYILEAEGVGT